MKLLFLAVSRDRSKLYEPALSTYLERIRPFVKTEWSSFATEEALVKDVDRLGGRAAPVLVLLDGRGKGFSSEEFAGWIGRQRDSGVQTLIFAVGPADGWSEEVRKRAGFLLSLGPMTLPHELARVVLMEQVYRAFTILTGHPYHRD